MVKKDKKKYNWNDIEEVDLDSLDLEKDEFLDENNDSNLDDFEDEDSDLYDDFWDENDEEEFIVGKQKDKWAKKIPVDRDEDKRRVGKWLKKFIDISIDPKILEWMSEEVQELMKKGKKEWKIHSRFQWFGAFCIKYIKK